MFQNDVVQLTVRIVIRSGYLLCAALVLLLVLLSPVARCAENAVQADKTTGIANDTTREAENVAASGELHDWQRIRSNALGYALQYRVFLPAGVAENARLPVLYVTDGEWFLTAGQMQQTLQRLLAAGQIAPLLVVFVDARDPDALQVNRRSKELLCNPAYITFFRDELMPAIAAQYPVSAAREQTGIAGVSFGGLNAACFGLLLPRQFGHLVMLSPANPQWLDHMAALYEAAPRNALQMYISVGTGQDNHASVRKFFRRLKQLGYTPSYREVARNHDWDNWRPLLDDVLRWFAAGSSSSSSANVVQQQPENS